MCARAVLLDFGVRGPSSCVGAVLFGTAAWSCQIPIVVGVAEFLDLGVTLRGVGYELRFQSTNVPYTITTRFDVVASSEYMVSNSDRYPHDYFGGAVDLIDDYAVVGAPLENDWVPEIQAVTTRSTSLCRMSGRAAAVVVVVDGGGRCCSCR